MIPNLRVFNLLIPLYPLCVALGFLLGTFILMRLGEKFGFYENNIFTLMCFAEVGVIIGGKAMFLLVNIQKLPVIIQKFGLHSIFTRTGFVFFGGLVGGIFSIWIFAKIYSLPFLKIFSFTLSVTPFIHAFGRIGCFCAGCCYGIKYEGVGTVYIHGAERLPVQLYEAFLNIILFIIIQINLIKKKNIIPIYFLGYGIIRFFCELLRGDEPRGFIGFFSISSWISLILIVLGLIFSIKKSRRDSL